MKQSFQNVQRGAARVSAVWMIVVVVMFFVAIAFAYIASQETAQVREQRDKAVAERDAERASYDSELDKTLELTSVLGFNDKEVVGSKSRLDLAKGGLDDLRLTFKDLDPSITTFADAAPIFVSAYKAKVAEIGTLEASISDLRSQVASLRTSISDLTTQKDDQIRTLQQQVTDAEDQKRQEVAGLEARIAAITGERNDKDTELRSTRGLVDDAKRVAEQDKLTLQARINALSDNLYPIITEPEAPDGKVLAVSKGLGMGWINLGSRNRLNRGMRFRVVSGSPTSDRQKAWAEVVSVGENSSEVRFSEIADPLDPVVQGDIVYNPVFDPDAQRNAVLVGRFSGIYSQGDLEVLLRDIGITVQKRLDNDTDFLIVGKEMYVDEEGEPLEDPMQPSETGVYKEAQAMGAQILSIGDVMKYFKK